ncbi:MAG: LysM peptidoglycan-binding domain-containing protein [Clostridia bacterium]|nr:LysM peptidoglycan-binding domain-containing protein [Clostridia bacterium]
MVIKSKKKLIRSTFVIIGLTIGLVLIMTGKTFSHQDLTYKKVAVVSGDTLWEIAKEEKENNDYYKDNDIRDIIANIKMVNNLKSSSLTVDQVLEIPTY